MDFMNFDNFWGLVILVVVILDIDLRGIFIGIDFSGIFIVFLWKIYVVGIVI